MKYFSLIHDQRVSRSRDRKILPAEEFSSLLDAKELVETTRQDAEQYRQEVVEECETLKREAELDGFDIGLDKWAEQLRLLEKEIGQVSEEMKKAIVPVALQAAKKVVGREIALDRETVVDIVANSLKAVTGHRRVTIYCHKDDCTLLREKKEGLTALFERLESLAIQERDDIEPNGCVIETEAGIINAQPTQVWRALESAFTAILKES